MSEFNNSAFLKGEVRGVDLSDLGSRVDARCRVNVYTDKGFVNVQLNSPKSADTNYAVKLKDKLNEGDKIQVRGSLEEFFYNDEYRRNISPYVSTANGWGKNIQIFDKDHEFDNKVATARISGDVIEVEPFYEDDGEFRLELTILHFNTYNRDDRDTPLTRREVLINTMQNFGDYAKRTDREVDFDALKSLMEDLEVLADEQVQEIVNIYKSFKKQFSPLMFNINEYHLTARGEIAEEMQDIQILDNISCGVYVLNETIIDEFGFADGSYNELRVGKFKGINENVGNADGTEVDTGGW